MKMYMLLGMSFVLLLSGCNDESGPESGSQDSPTKVEVNVAASINGAAATSDYKPDDAKNLIDGDETTWWASHPEEPIVVEFEEVEDVVSLQLTRTAASAQMGTDPDILIELSEDGAAYTNVNFFSALGGGGGVACNSATMNATTLSCTLSEARATQFVRITSYNGKSFEFIELEVIAMK